MRDTWLSISLEGCVCVCANCCAPLKCNWQFRHRLRKTSTEISDRMEKQAYWRRCRLDGWMNGGVLEAHVSLAVLNRPLMKLILRQMVLFERARPETWNLPARINTWLWCRKPGTFASNPQCISSKYSSLPTSCFSGCSFFYPSLAM